MNKISKIFFACGALIFAFGLTNNVLAKATKSNKQSVSVVASKAKSEINLSVNINVADAAALQKIKGIGKKKAEAIIAYREQNGSFKSVEDLLKVKCRGINKKWLDKISSFLTV